MSESAKYALLFSYDSRHFDGYPKDSGKNHVENHLVRAFAEEGCRSQDLQTGSRTDRGVSAIGNVCGVSFDPSRIRGIIPRVQRQLPLGVTLRSIAHVPEGWSARKAESRTYRYFLVGVFDERQLKTLCDLFVGTHDFSAFCRMEKTRNPVRTVSTFTPIVHADHCEFVVTSRSFLWNQIRRMVGAIQSVVSGKTGIESILESFKTGIPHPSFEMAPPGGLLLESVAYNPPLEWLTEAGKPNEKPLAQLLQEQLRDAAVIRGVTKHHLHL